MKILDRMALGSIDLAMVAAFALPLWITWGRSFFDAGGWLLLIMSVTVLPVMIALLLACATRIRRARARGIKDIDMLKVGYWLLVTYASGVLLGLSLLDFGDSENRGTSILTERFDWAASASASLSVIAGLIFAVSIIGAVIAAFALSRKTDQPSAQPRQ